MTKEKFVYVTYIATTPQKAWQALIDGEMTRQYWDHDNVSDWQPGSTWEHRRGDANGPVDIVGEVIESDSPRRLVMTWAAPADAADRSRHSRVAIDIEAVGDAVRLSVTRRARNGLGYAQGHQRRLAARAVEHEVLPRDGAPAGHLAIERRTKAIGACRRLRS